MRWLSLSQGSEKWGGLQLLRMLEIRGPLQSLPLVLGLSLHGGCCCCCCCCGGLQVRGIMAEASSRSWSTLEAAGAGLPCTVPLAWSSHDRWAARGISMRDEE
jgi:hypothetical protein